MKSSPFLLALVLGTALPTATVHAQTYAPPVGFRTFFLEGGADTPVVPTLMRPAVHRGTAATVSGTSVTLDNNFTSSALTGAASAYYLQAVDGTAAGRFAALTSVSATGVVLATDLNAAGLAAGDAVQIVPFWTLATLFPSGNGLYASASIFAPASRVLVPDETSAGINLSSPHIYFYHDGSQTDAGWYEDGNLAAGRQDDLILSPDRYLMVRHPSGTDYTYISLKGEISLAPLGSTVVRRQADTPQDHALGIALSTDLTLAQLDLAASDAFSASPNVLAPTDRLLVYPTAPDSTNVSAIAIYFYHDGSQMTAGWYREGALGDGLANTTVITGGSRVTIRRAGDTRDTAQLTLTPDYLTTWNK